MKLINNKLTAAYLILPVVATVALSSAAFAISPHFVNANASFVGSGPNLSIAWKEAGLGDTVSVDYLASADATADYACINGGGNHPKATNKETVNGPVSAAGTFTSGKNGAINGSLTVSPPSAGGFSCPNGQGLTLARVSYTDATITDTTNGVTQNLNGTFCRQFVNLPEFACN